MRPCFKFTAKTTAKAAVLALDEEIGFWGTQAKDFRAELDAVEGKELIVEINSIGGDVMAGLGIYNMLRTWATAEEGRSVTTRVTGLAASISSIIALAGDKREMPKNTFAMTHSASSVTWGTAEDMRDAAATLDKVDSSLRSIYVDRMGVDEAKAKEIMAKDTWLTAEECKDLGFATVLTDDIKATAKYDLARAELPENVAALFKPKAAAPAPAPAVAVVENKAFADELVALCKTAGLEAHASAIALQSESLDAGKARITAVTEIIALCKLADREKDAGKHIKSNKSVADVRAALVKAMADADEHVDTTQPAKKSTAQAGGKPASQVYAERAERKAARRQATRK